MPEFEVTYVNVGHGDATLIKVPRRRRSITCSKALVTLRGQPSLVSHLQNDAAEPGQSDEEDDSREDLETDEVEH